MRLAFLATLALAPAACAPAPPPVRPGPAFDPFAFFDGATEGRARLRILFRSARTVHVLGRGRLDLGGDFILDQRVEEEGKPARDRRWRLRRVGPGRYAGTLTDAAGPVTAETAGNRLHICYPMKGGLSVEQWLSLRPDGRAADNRLVVTKLGVRVARLDEVIKKTRRPAGQDAP